LPRKEGKRQKILKSLAHESKTIIFYESPRRVKRLIDDLIKTLGNRQSVLSREMTKLHEEFVRGTLSEILDVLADRREIKGECTLVVHGGVEQETLGVDALRQELIQGLHQDGIRLSDLVKNIVKHYGLPKKQVYAEALKVKSLYASVERDDVASEKKE